MIKENKDTSSIRDEIRVMTTNFVDSTEIGHDIIKKEFEEIKNEFDTMKVYDKEKYNSLIRLYRESLFLAKDISQFKKYLRTIKK